MLKCLDVKGYDASRYYCVLAKNERERKGRERNWKRSRGLGRAREGRGKKKEGKMGAALTRL